MKIFTVLSAVMFAMFVVAGTAEEGKTELGNQIQKQEVWKYKPEIICCAFT
jgi:hypothetical protein